MPELTEDDRFARAEGASHVCKRTVWSHGGRVERSVTTTVDREPGEREEGSGGHTSRERAFALGLVIAIGVVYLVVHLLFIPRDWPPGWDESVYLSQVTPGMEGVYFNPWHARGITLIVAPATALGGSTSDVRLYLMVLSAIAIAATFGLWASLVGVAAAIAAFLFSFSWLGLLLASQVEPNYWGAILCLATVGTRYEEARRWSDARPGAGVGASGRNGAGPADRRDGARRRGGRIRPRVQEDVVARPRPAGHRSHRGWLPWVIEMSARFGGLGGAFRAAGQGQHFEIVPVADNVLRHLLYTDGNDAGTRIPGAIWWGLLIVMAAVAIGRGMTKSDRAAARLASLAALALASEYLLFVPALTPRFLLPAYALASVPFGIGLASSLRRRGISRVLGVLVLTLMIPWTIWQGTVTARRAPGVNVGSALSLRVGLLIRRLAEGRPCYVLTQRTYPQITYTARCSGAKAGRELPSTEELRALAKRGQEVFVVLGKEAPDASLLSSIEPVHVLGTNRGWYVYPLPESIG